MAIDESSRLNILKPEEIEALAFADSLYGAEAKLAAIALANSLNLSEGAQAELLHAISSRIDAVEFQDKIEIAGSLKSLRTVLGLGGSASQAALNGNGHVAELGLVDLHLTGPNNGAIEQGDPADRDPQLGKLQTKWLKSVFGEHNIDTVKQLDVSQRDELIARLGEIYKSLTIMRLGTEAKERKVQQLAEFMNGVSIADLSAKSNIQEQSIRASLNTTAAGIASRVPNDQLTALLEEIASKKSGEVLELHPDEGR